jgi:hypothetical protein
VETQLGYETSGKTSMTDSPDFLKEKNVMETKIKKTFQKTELKSKSQEEAPLLRKLPKEAPKDGQSPVLPYQIESSKNQSKKYL